LQLIAAESLQRISDVEKEQRRKEMKDAAEKLL
jgi:hypothetical protein